MNPFGTYLTALDRNLAHGDATEHTHRAAVAALIESVAEVQAINEPRRTACGAPDFLVAAKGAMVGYVETKDVGESLDQAERTPQLRRYQESLRNLVLTDYLEFRWYVDGTTRAVARLARRAPRGDLAPELGGEEAVRRLLNGFLAHRSAPVRQPRELALRLANLTHMVRETIVRAFETGAASPSLAEWRAAFARVLLHDLDRPERLNEFADMFAQTIVHGLFSARVMAPDGDAFSRREAQRLIPKSNPFLRQFFYRITGPDLEDEPFAPFVNDLAATLAQTDMAAVLNGFGESTRTRDPVVHFYETFLAAYDPALRESRGVYYTPEPAVGYIVRSVDELLRRTFGLARGLADDSKLPPPRRQRGSPPPPTPATLAASTAAAPARRLLILDPACGTGTFLYGIVDHIRREFMARGDAGLWPHYVRESLLPRLIGFELLMAPYAIAHFKLTLQLAARDLPPADQALWACHLPDDQRLRIFLTNALEDLHDPDALPGVAQWIARETVAASEVKRELPIMVVLGNPPYSGHSENKGDWIADKVRDYYFVDGQPLGERNPKWLQDDYVKFIRFGQHRLDLTGGGILAFVCNNGFLDNPTFRGMRQSLLMSFTDLYLLNLHGSQKKRETAPDGSADENIFDIRQGVCIAILVKDPATRRKARVHYADLWGSREAKYAALSRSHVRKTRWTRVDPQAPFHLFVPRDEERKTEYERGWRIPDAMPVNVLGFQTHRDEVAVAFDERTLLRQVSSYLGRSPTADRWEAHRTACAYRPLDMRFAFLDKRVSDRPRNELLHHVLGRDNLCLGVGRQGSAVNDARWSLVTVSRLPMDANIFRRGGVNVFPLYLFNGTGELDLEAAPRKPNLAPAFVAALAARLKLDFVRDGAGDLKRTFGPEDVLRYFYAVLHSPGYRSRYAEFLKTDFPRLPLTGKPALFGKLVDIGARLVSLHTMESPDLDRRLVSYPTPGDNVVERIAYRDDSVLINAAQSFRGVPAAAWAFRVGGYAVCEKWLKDRKGRALTHDDLRHYQRLVVAADDTARLMTEADRAIAAHGGWPLE